MSGVQRKAEIFTRTSLRPYWYQPARQQCGLQVETLPFRIRRSRGTCVGGHLQTGCPQICEKQIELFISELISSKSVYSAHERYFERIRHFCDDGAFREEAKETFSYGVG